MIIKSHGCIYRAEDGKIEFEYLMFSIHLLSMLIRSSICFLTIVNWSLSVLRLSSKSSSSTGWFLLKQLGSPN